MEQNRLARDSYGVLHRLLIAGIILTALGVKKTIADIDEPLETVAAVALCGGVAALPARARRDSDCAASEPSTASDCSPP